MAGIALMREKFVGRFAVLLLAVSLQAGCVASPGQGSVFAGQDVRDFANGLIVLGDQPNDRIRVGHNAGEFRLDLPYATDWGFQPTNPERPLDARSQSLGLIVTVQLYQPGRRVDPLRYLREGILANTTAGIEGETGVEPRNVRISDHRGHPVLEYDLDVSETLADGTVMAASQHNLRAVRQRDSDDVVIDLHISTTVPAAQATDASLLRLRDQVAEMMGAGFEVRPRCRNKLPC